MTREVVLVGPDGRRSPDVLTEPIGATGSQGSVWQLREHPGTVAKIAHRTDPYHLATRLRAMLERPAGWAARDGRVTVAWPVAAVHRRRDDMLLGYAAPKLAPPRFVPLPLVLNPVARGRLLPGATWAWWLTLAEDLARTMHAAHQQGHVVGDLAPANLFVTRDGGAALVDADGWQLHDPRTGTDLLCPFSRPEYTAPEDLEGPARRRTPASDGWAVAVLVTQLLCLGFHPFGGVPPGTSGIVEETDNVRARRSWLLGADVRTPAAAPPPSVLPELLLRRLREAIGTGHDDPDARPRALDWAAALARTRRTLRTCPDRPAHLFGADTAECPWCAVIAAGARDPFPPTHPGGGP